MHDVPVPTVAIAGSATRFPVRRIFCVGQNYAEHTREMGGDPSRPAPFFFTKPGDAVVDSGSVLAFPRQTADLHHEVELVVAIGTGGSDIAAADALAHVFGHGVGIDLTRRDLQAAAKAAGRPWDMAKGFDESAPVGPLTPGAPPAAGAISLTVNDELRQSGDIAQMIWSVAEIIATLSRFVVLAPGDLIFTGTPAGVGPIRPGQAVSGRIAGLAPIDIAYAG
ncbi:fumarylacetoacetate hydrolase family protein [Polymorphobacter fuscus]|uniref:FAA hydrolase family protein n=1 Tax=Sandarakinorhabdus fusca TaxID=1439888 RepID=A0A7C9GM27_9SPHN|nr:fumarylacetoacetate hydrolase family protein [Polymorphobacter fuscus]KAB7648161.1 fumarylacetoacetate hydrolase family protein [Polymorphobacter fuscus]MQT15657.1 FAA hydrolase family protein [Polymorphobacter fuscus]NJC08073.1 fumarylpyruvate hydrolase [Polymorphobacter fuscus]